MPCWSCPVNLSRSDQDFHSLRCHECLPSVAQGKATTVTVKKRLRNYPRGKKRKLKASSLFLICGQSLCCGTQALRLVKREFRSESSLLLQLQMLFTLGFAPQPGCDCVCAEPTHRNFLVQFKTESYIYWRLAFFFFCLWNQQFGIFSISLKLDCEISLWGKEVSVWFSK